MIQLSKVFRFLPHVGFVIGIFLLGAGVGILSTYGYIMNLGFTPPDPFMQAMAMVAPPDGYSLPITWGDIGPKLIASGAIDPKQFTTANAEQAAILAGTSTKNIAITPENAHFVLNFLWALGLTNKSDVLSKGPMTTEVPKDQLANFASTGGWTLGTQPATKLFSSAEIIPLTPAQQALVMELAKNIFRPCCNNPTSMPDCNHGMAMLGLLELLASQNVPKSDILKAGLAFNSYWFPDTYVNAAVYLKERGTAWRDADPAELLSAKFSSGSGSQQISRAITTPRQSAPQGGGGCAA